jgi:thiol:disulfide interchange protein DsbD
MEHKTFSDPRVIREANRFRRLRVDATNASDPRVLAATRRHSVKGFPTVIFFDSTGKELSENRVVGFVSADEFLALLRRVR